MLTSDEGIQSPHQPNVVLTDRPSLPADSSHILTEPRDILGNVTEAISSFRGQVSDFFDHFFEVCCKSLNPVDLIPKIGVIGVIVLDLTLNDINLLIQLLKKPPVLIPSLFPSTLTDERDGQVEEKKDNDSEKPPQVVYFSPVHWTPSPPDLPALI